MVARTLYKILDQSDTLTCDAGGKVDLGPVKERQATIDDAPRIVCDDDLLHRTPIKGCGKSPPCKMIVSIEAGLSLFLELEGDTPVLSDLDATTDRGCKVRGLSALALALIAEEGTRGKLNGQWRKTGQAYKDSKGIWTIGVGHNIDVAGGVRSLNAALGTQYTMKDLASGVDADVVLTPGQMWALLDIDMQTYTNNVRALLGTDAAGNDVFDSLTDDQQQGVIDLDFNRGDGTLRKYATDFVEYLRKGDFDAAANEVAGHGPNAAERQHWQIYGNNVHERRVNAVVALIASKRGPVVAHPK